MKLKSGPPCPASKHEYQLLGPFQPSTEHEGIGSTFDVSQVGRDLAKKSYQAMVRLLEQAEDIPHLARDSAGPTEP